MIFCNDVLRVSTKFLSIIGQSDMYVYLTFSLLGSCEPDRHKHPSISASKGFQLGFNY